MPARLSTTSTRLIALVAVLGAAAVVALVAAVVTAGHQRVDPNAARVTLPPVTPAARATPNLLDAARADIGRVITVEAVRANSEESLGTGWLLDGRGDFVTNAHVIAGQIGVRVRDRDGHTHFASVIGVDATEDVALVRSSDGFAVATGLTIEPISALSPPQGVVVIASGRATGQPDVTLESLSRSRADVPVKGNPDLQPGTSTTTVYRNMLELEGARIYQGNSGGPVLDSQGKVVGIVTLASKSGANAYAIPIWRVLPELQGWASR